MKSKFSDKYALFDGVQMPVYEAYSAIYPQELLEGIFTELSIPNDKWEECRSHILHAAMYFEVGKANLIEYYHPPNLHIDLLKRFKTNSRNLRKSYQECLDSMAWQHMFMRLPKRNYGEGKTERSREMVSKLFGHGQIFTKSLPDFLETLEQMIDASLENPSWPRKPTSATVMNNWIRNISNVFKLSSIPYSSGSYQVRDEPSHAMRILGRLMAPLDPVVSTQMIGEGLKDFHAEQGKQRLGKTE